MDHRSAFSRYTVAIATVLIALVLRLFLSRWLGASSPFMFFALAVMLSAWYGGLGPGLLATVAGAGLINIFLLPPDGAFWPTTDEISRIVLFLIVGLQISWLSDAMLKARERAEADAQAARQSERLYRMLASNFPDGFVGLFDEELRWTLVAGAGLTAAGLSREQMEGLLIAQTLPGESAPTVQEMCAAAFSGSPAQREITQRGRVYFTHALPLKTLDESEHVGMIIFEDVTERVAAREALQTAHDTLEQHVRQRTAQLRFQQTLLESQIQASADGILALGKDGKVIFANRRFSEIWRLIAEPAGTDPAQLKAEMRGQLADPLQVDPFSDAAPQFGINSSQTPGLLVLHDGRILERYSAPILDPDGTSHGRVWFFRDVSERQRMQREVLEAGERERRRFGQDLHDDLCQQLAGIACVGQTLQQRLSRQQRPDAAQDAADAAELVAMLQRANERARDLARGLQPITLRQQGLVAALQQLSDSIASVFGVSCSFRSDPPHVEIDEAIGIQLYRICQEAINNAIRHGKPNAVSILLEAYADRIMLTIEDDGCGIPQPLPQKGLGLYTMNYRAQTIGGMLRIDASEKRGTIVRCSVPLGSARTHQTVTV